MRIAAVLVLMATPSLAFDGLYRPEGDEYAGWDCRTVGMDGGALAVSGGRLHGVENLCELTNPVAVRGMDAVLYDAECAGEGETYAERLMLMRTAEGIALIRDGFVSLLRRCE